MTIRRRVSRRDVLKIGLAGAGAIGLAQLGWEYWRRCEVSAYVLQQLGLLVVFTVPPLALGHYVAGWNVFGLILVTFLLVALASAVIRIAFAPLPDFLDGWLGSLVAHSLTIPFAAAALTSAYFRLTTS